jgi:hypothetical protein
MWNQFKTNLNEDVEHTVWPTTVGMVALLLFAAVGATHLFMQ